MDGSSLRPQGTVEVSCQHPGCGIAWWVEPLHPSLPDGPWDCGDDHEATREVRTAFARLRFQTGFHWGSMRGLGPERSGHGCMGGRSYKAGVAQVWDRLRAGQGVIEWSDPSELQDVRKIESRIRWGLTFGPGETDIGPVPPKYPAAPGHVFTVGYQWMEREVRRYTFLKCARPGCPHHLMVDYDKPFKRCRAGETYAVGAWGGGDLPEPSWWGTLPMTCGSGLSTTAPYPCNIVHGSEVLGALELDHIVWTMWSMPGPDFVGYVLFFDKESKVYGLLSYTELPEDIPIEFQSISTLRRRIRWGSLRSLVSEIDARGYNDISTEIHGFLGD